MTKTHLVIGAGEVGSALALQLADLGKQVVVVTRSGKGPDHINIPLTWPQVQAIFWLIFAYTSMLPSMAIIWQELSKKGTK